MQGKNAVEMPRSVILFQPEFFQRRKTGAAKKRRLFGKAEPKPGIPFRHRRHAEAQFLRQGIQQGVVFRRKTL